MEPDKPKLQICYFFVQANPPPPLLLHFPRSITEANINCQETIISLVLKPFGYPGKKIIPGLGFILYHFLLIFRILPYICVTNMER